MAINEFTIGAAGDYPTLSGWEEARQTAGSPGDIERAVILDGVYSITGASLCLLNGWNTGVDIEIVAQNSHTGDWNVTNQGVKFLLYNNFGRGIESRVANKITIKDIVFQAANNGNYIQGFLDENLSTNISRVRVFENLMFSGFGNFGTTTQSAIIVGNHGTNTTGNYNYTIDNCVFWNCPRVADGSALYLNSWSSSIAIRGNFLLRGNTFYNASIWTRRTWTGFNATITGVGNLFYNLGTGVSLYDSVFSGTYSATSIDQIGSESDGPHEIYWNGGMHNYLSATSVGGAPSAGQVGFVDTGAGNFRLYDSVNNVALNYVTGSPFVTGDILYNNRGSAPYDAGAFELESSSIDVEIEPGVSSLNIDISTGSISAVVEPDTTTYYVNTSSGHQVQDTLYPRMYAANRLSGTIPLAVLFSALSGSSMLQPPAGLSHKDFTYIWNFPVTGQFQYTDREKNLGGNFLAGCVFLNTGVHRVTCELIDTSGNSYFYEQSITALDPDILFTGNTYYVDNTSGNNANPGTIDSPWKTFKYGIDQIYSSNGPKRLLLKRGETWVESGLTTATRTGPFLIGAYGVGEKPIFQTTNNSNAINVVGSITTITDLEFVNMTALTGSGARAIDISATGCTIYNCELQSSITAFGGNQNDTSIVSTYVSGAQYGMYFGGGTGYYISDVYFGGATSEHHLRTYTAKTLVDNNYFSNTIGNVTKNAIKMVGIDLPNPEKTDNVISYNDFDCVCNWIVSIGPENTTSEQYISRILVEGNTFSGATSTSVHVASNRDCWIRNNVFENGSSTVITVDSRYTGIIPTGVVVEHNTAYSSTANRTLVTVLNALGKPIVNNNLIYTPGYTASIANNLSLISYTGNLTGNPGFLDVASNDFRLTAGSIALNTAIPGNLRQDRNLVQRNVNSGDVGAYEGAFSLSIDVDVEPDTYALYINTGTQAVSISKDTDSINYYINSSTGQIITTTNNVQTILNVYESSYRIGKHHVFFNLRDSIPKQGPMWKGLGEWYVYSSTNTLIKQVNGVLDFSYIGQNGDTLYARYIDSYGYTGDWETYVFDVLPNSAADMTYYVASYGSNSNSGTADSPFATPQYAISTIRSSLLSGETAVLYVSGNTTYSFSGVGWAGGSTPRLVRVLKWGNGTNPIFHMTNNNSMFVLGNAESVQLEGICLSGNTGIAAGNYGISVSKDNSSTNYPNCSYIMSGSVDRFYIGIGSSDSITNGGRYSGHHDFFGIEDTTFYDNSTYHIYGMRYRRYNHVVNPTFYEPRGDIDVANRLQMWADHYCEGWKCLYTGVTTNIRLQGGDFTVDNGDEYFGPGSWYSGEIVSAVNENGISLQSDAPASGMAIHKDMRFVNWKIGNGRFELVGYTTGANCSFDRIDIINSSMHNTNSIAVIHNTGVPYGYVGELRVINNIGFISTDTAPRFFTCNAPLAYTQTGTLTFISNVWSIASGTSGGSKSFYQFANITRDQAADLFVESDNNHVGKFDLSAPFMLRASDGDDLIAAWRTRSTFDQNSTINLSYSDPLGIVAYPTQYGYGANGRIASTGSPLYNAGYPSEYSLDYDGYLRDSILPDAGPYEFSATEFPTPPITGQEVDVDIEPNTLSVSINTYNSYGYIYVEDSSDEIQVDPVDPDTLIGAQPVTSSNLVIAAYTVTAIDVTSNIYTDPDPVEFLITPYIQSAEGQIDIDIEPAAISEIYYSIVTPTVLANSDTVYANPTGQTVVFDQPSVGTISSIVYLEEDPSVIGYNISAGVEILAGTGVVTYPGYGSLLVTVVTPVVSTTSLPGGNIPGMPVEPNASSKEYYDYEYVPNQNIDSTNLRVDDNFTTQENISNKDIDIVPILEIATNVNNDVTRLNQHLSETFIRNTIQQTSRVENKNKIRIVTANYQKFTSSTNGSASRFQIRRK